MNKFVWILMLPLLVPFIVVGFVFTWGWTGLLMGALFAKQLGDWVGGE